MQGFEARPEEVEADGKAMLAAYAKYTEAKDKIYSTLAGIKSAWTGADAGGYATAVESYEADFVKLASIIEELGEKVRVHGVQLQATRDAIKAEAAKL